MKAKHLAVYLHPSGALTSGENITGSVYCIKVKDWRVRRSEVLWGTRNSEQHWDKKLQRYATSQTHHAEPFEWCVESASHGNCSSSFYRPVPFVFFFHTIERLSSAEKRCHGDGRKWLKWPWVRQAWWHAVLCKVFFYDPMLQLQDITLRFLLPITEWLKWDGIMSVNISTRLETGLAALIRSAVRLFDVHLATHHHLVCFHRRHCCPNGLFPKIGYLFFSPKNVV